MNKTIREAPNFILFVMLVTNITGVKIGGGSGSDNPAIAHQTADSVNLDLAEPLYFPPVAINDEYTLTVNVPLNVDAPGILENDFDPDGEAITAMQQTDPTHGSVNLSDDGSFTYTPDQNYTGLDSFIYIASDGVLTDTATVSITINQVPAFTAFPRIGAVDLNVTFTNLSEDPSFSTWDYGDGIIESITTTVHTHTYTESGIYTPTLTIRDDSGPHSVAYPGYIAVYETGSENAFYADANFGDDLNGNGTQDAPWKTITNSLNQMHGVDLELRVASGLYDQSLGEAFPIMMKSGISVAGADYHYTTVKGISSQPVFYFPSNVIFEANTKLSGLKITKGNSGVKIDGFTGIDVSPIISNNWITENTYGIYIYSQSGRRAQPLIANNLIGYNSRGLYIYVSYGGVVIDPEVRNNVIVNNIESGIYCFATGGGSSYYGLCNPTITNNYIGNNPGNGITCHTTNEGGCNSIIDANVITNNGGWGWGRVRENSTLHPTEPLFINNFIYGNSDGGAQFINNYSCNADSDKPVFVNNTIVFNGLYGILDGCPASIVNNIVWGHYNDLNAPVEVVSYSDVSQGPYAGQNYNVSIDPQFVNKSMDDYHLLPTSPILNLGDNTAPNLPIKDFDGDPRIVGSTVDIGADEVWWMPDATDDAYQILEDTPISADVLANDSDPFGDPLSIASVGDPLSGQATINGTVIIYTPATDFNGQDVFTYTIENDHGGSDIALVTIVVMPVNDAPIASNDSYVTDEDTPLNVFAPGVLGNDNDVDSPVLTATLSEAPPNGDLTLFADGAFSYMPSPNFNGLTTFFYFVSDGVLTDTGRVDISINPVNDPPVAADSSFTTQEDIPYSDQLIASDIDGDPLTYASDTLPANGTLEITPSGIFTYTPNLNFNGTDVFTFIVSDGILYDIGQIDIAITPVNDPPIVEAGPDQTINEGQIVQFSGTYTDSGQSLQISYVSRYFNLQDLNLVEISWNLGDGTLITDTLTPTHTYADDGIYIVTLVITDEQGASGMDSLVATVANVAPDLGPLTDQSCVVGEGITLTAAFTDPGVLDTHIVKIDWDDGITETLYLESGVVNFNGAHIYTYAGEFFAIVTLMDNAGGVDSSMFNISVIQATHKVLLPMMLKQ